MTDEDTERAQAFRQLRVSLRSLATAGDEQRMLFADLVVSAGDLASHYDQSAAVIRADYEADLSAAQSHALAAIDRKLATMSRDGDEFDADLWTDAALRSGEHWAEIRQLASAALDAFGWPIDRSPQGSEGQESGVES